MGMYDCIGREWKHEESCARASANPKYCIVSNCVERFTITVPMIFANIEVCEKHYKSMKKLFNDFSSELDGLRYHFFFHSGVSQDCYGWGSTQPNPRQQSGNHFCDWHTCRTSNGFEGFEDDGTKKWFGAKLLLIPTVFGCFQVCDEHHDALREELHELSKAFEILKDSLMGRLRKPD